MNAQRGINDGYPRTQLKVTDAARNSRYFPFRETSLSATIMAPSGRNTGDSKAAQEMSGQGSFVTSKPAS